MALYVNGLVVTGGGGNANTWEGTQAEYDALVSKDPDTVYFITDTNGDGSQFQPVIYSENEREIGVWTDGKPVYQKTVHIASLPSATITATNYPHGVSNIDAIVNYDGVIRWSNGGTAKVLRVGLFTSSAADLIPSMITVEVDPTNIVVTVGQNRSNLSADVTLWYTKTTDTAGSGQWTPQGVPAIHYSATEQVVGTWIDGKTLYEKTVVIPSGTLRAGDNITDISGLGVDIVVGQPSACIVFDNGAGMRTIPFAISGNYGVEIFADKSRIVIVRKSGDLAYDNIFVTLRYTKAST